ncbi:MAG: hypothetical protein ABSA46_10105 [Thermodesulfovibrionales bacterium]
MKVSAPANAFRGERRSEKISAEGGKMSIGRALTAKLQCPVCKEVRDLSLPELNSLFMTRFKCNCGERLDPKRDLVANDEPEKSKND